MMRQETLLRIAGAVLVAALLVFQGVAPATAGGAMLVVRNAANPERPEARLTEEELLDLPQTTVRTHTEWTDGKVEFVGPLARDVVELVGADGASIAHLVAANDYSVDVPLEDFFEYDVILAMFADGERLTRRDKGPLWVMYPLDAHEELQDSVYNPRMIWQLTTVELK